MFLSHNLTYDTQLSRPGLREEVGVENSWGSQNCCLELSLLRFVNSVSYASLWWWLGTRSGNGRRMTSPAEIKRSRERERERERDSVRQHKSVWSSLAHWRRVISRHWELTTGSYHDDYCGLPAILCSHARCYLTTSGSPVWIRHAACLIALVWSTNCAWQFLAVSAAWGEFCATSTTTPRLTFIL